MATVDRMVRLLISAPPFSCSPDGGGLHVLHMFYSRDLDMCLSQDCLSVQQTNKLKTQQKNDVLTLFTALGDINGRIVYHPPSQNES